MIDINNLSLTYKSKNRELKVLENINFSFDSEETISIIGPSGCGKSTFLNILAGIIKNYEGEVLLNKVKLSPHIHKIGYIPQNFGLLPWKNVRENILIPFTIKKEKLTKEKGDKLNYLMKRLGVDNLNHKYPSEISGGQKQRVSIVRAFFMEPDILLMDEAFSALDAIIREEAQELFLNTWHENKIPTFMVTHSIDEALYMGKKIIIMSSNKGNILRVIENPLFNDKEYKNSKEYPLLYTEIKALIKEGLK